LLFLLSLYPLDSGAGGEPRHGLSYTHIQSHHAMKKIHLLVVEDNRLLREGIITMLDKEPDIRIAAALENGGAALSVMQKMTVDAVLLNLGPEHQNNVNLVRAIKKAKPDMHVMVMDLVELQSEILELVQAGVSGFILKDATGQELLQTIRSVADGVIVLPPYLAKSLFSQIVEHGGTLTSPAERVRTTKRQRQVIGLIASGLTNKEIARQLHLSPYTVKSHVHNILEKFSLHTRVQIANQIHSADSYTAAMNTITLMEN
jgi:DNA-binding NarL/FixJ family response regulator